MLKQHVCPKCRHNRILAIAAIPDADDTSLPRELHVATVPNPDRGFFAAMMIRAGRLQAAVCRACGYTELYTTAPDQIPIDGEWVRELVGPEPVGPYR